LPLLVHGAATSAGPQPVTVGLPFPKGLLPTPEALTLFDAAGDAIPLQTAVLARWSDGSAKWVLLDFIHEPGNGPDLELVVSDRKPDAELPAHGLSVGESTECLVVQSGPTRFEIDRRSLHPLRRVILASREILDGDHSRVVLTEAGGRHRLGKVKNVAIETVGPLRATVRMDGEFAGRTGARFIARLSFFGDTGLVRCELTLHNPNRARHRGGLWDLGDAGSIFFRDLSLELALSGSGRLQVSWSAEPGQRPSRAEAGALEIYQDSSGGENWRSNNHKNQLGQVPCLFRGYRIRADGEEIRGQRASPVLSLQNDDWAVDAAVPEFWQQFPKAIEVDRRTLRVRLFPKQFGDVFELQGGEQKTQTVWLRFGDPGHPPLNWAHEPVHVQASPEWYAASGALPYFLPAAGTPIPASRNCWPTL